MVTRMKAVGDSGFDVRTQAEEKESVPGPEQVSWIALSQGTDGSSHVGTTGRVVDQNDHTISIPTDKGTNAYFFAAQQTFNGPDTATLRTRS